MRHSQLPVGLSVVEKDLSMHWKMVPRPGEAVVLACHLMLWAATEVGWSLR